MVLRVTKRTKSVTAFPDASRVNYPISQLQETRGEREASFSRTCVLHAAR